MELAAILIVSGLVLLLSYFLFKEAAGSMSLIKLNMISYLFYIPLVLMSFIGSVFIVLKLDNHYLVNKLQFDSSRYYGWLAILYSMIVFPIGILLAKKLFDVPKVKSNVTCYAEKPLSSLLGKGEIVLKSFLIGLSILALLVLAYTFLQLGTIPLIAMLKGESSELARLRILASREFGGNVYLRNILGVQILPLLSFVALAYFHQKKTLINLLWFVATLLGSLLILSYDLQKSPMALYLTGFVFYAVWVNGHISVGKLAAFGGLFLGIIILFYMAFGNSNLQNILFQYNEGATGRVLFSQVVGTFFSIEFFDNLREFIGLNSLSKMVEYFGLEYSERSSRLIMEIINPKGVAAGTAGVQNSLFIGEAWANFGAIGLFISPLYVGFIIGLLFYALLSLPKAPIFVGVYVFFSYKTALIGGFNDYIYNIAYASVILILCIVLVYANQISKKLRLGIQ